MLAGWIGIFLDVLFLHSFFWCFARKRHSRRTDSLIRMDDMDYREWKWKHVGNCIINIL